MYMLDTNMVSNIVTERSVKALEVFRMRRNDQLCISAVTVGEMLFGVARRPDATKLNGVILSFLKDIKSVDWTAATASIYARVRADTEKNGKPLGALDMMIAAHALETGAVLVTADKAFAHISALRRENWAD